MNNKKLRFHDYIFMLAGILLFLTMLSLWFLCGLFAKYTVNDSSAENARVAEFGFVEVKEHKVVEKQDVMKPGEQIEDVYYSNDEYYDMVYKLDMESEVDTNFYGIMMPGVDIPKDPFVRVTAGEVDCELYIEITEIGIPTEFVDIYGKKHEPLVTYNVDDTKWNLESSKKDSNGNLVCVYKYLGTIKAGSKTQEIGILKDNKIYISQYYDADGFYNGKNPESGDFSITFNAWMGQID